MNHLVISASLNPESNSRLLARAAERALAAAGYAVAFADLRELALPPCDGAAAYSHPHTARARELVTAAAGIVIATPVYNYDANASVKNLIELTGRAWENKIVGFACAAGGTTSYMSIMGLANSLMLDFRCTVVPRFVYATEADFAGDAITNALIAQRTEELALSVARYAQALQN
ncbi:MAG: NADPH-dependent FMN reductase [Candidatus Didemnitutus sp.]|nr:NADPH-dependent FMN reductase [Candidatus Didemnitutus sp.]